MMGNERRHHRLMRVITSCVRKSTIESEISDDQLIEAIQKGNLPALERVLNNIKHPMNDFEVLVKRRYLNSVYPYLMDPNPFGTDPFTVFYQHCSPVIWAIDCLQVQVLPLLSSHGFDVNRPQSCRRWTHTYTQNSKPNIAAYKRFWTRGKYTYQSVLDYFFASVFELSAEQISNPDNQNGPSPLFIYFPYLKSLLSKGVDVHRIDSVIIFNSLASSFDSYLCHYANEDATIPDIPEGEDDFMEMTALSKLIENGFSQFECMDYLHPCWNWFGILFCLLCHPKIGDYGSNILPPIIRQAALLVINLLSLKCRIASIDDFRESLETLHLRKVYSKRYNESRTEFNERLTHLHESCQNFMCQPFSLAVLCRRVIRRQLGGNDFYRKLNHVGLPEKLSSYVRYIGLGDLKSSYMPDQLIELAHGGWRSENLQKTINNTDYTKFHESISLPLLEIKSPSGHAGQ